MNDVDEEDWVAQTNDEDAGGTDDWIAKHFDEKTGEKLDESMVKEARREELEFMKRIGLYEEVDVSECWQMTG